MKIVFNIHDSKLKLGVPYTWGLGNLWYMRVSEDLVVQIEEVSRVAPEGIATLHIAEATSFHGFRYAESLEIR